MVLSANRLASFDSTAMVGGGNAPCQDEILRLIRSSPKETLLFEPCLAYHSSKLGQIIKAQHCLAAIQASITRQSVARK
jgi:hypothetical protein